MPSTNAAAIEYGAGDALLAALRLGLFQRRGPAAAADAAALAQVADWKAVAALAQRHQASGLLLQGLRTQGDLLAASGIEGLLKKRRDRAVRRSLRQLRGLRQALDCLAAQNIPCLVLKGLPLSQRLYGNALLRDAVDMDLLVSPEHFQAAERELLQGGWRKISKFRETPMRNRWYAHCTADSRLSGPSGTLELHHRFFDNPHYFNLEFKQLSARAASVTIGNASFPTMHEDDDLLYLMCHGAKHLWTNLKWLCDVALIFADMSPLRLERVAARCREAKLEPILASTLEICRDALHVQVGASSAAALQAHRPQLFNGRRTAFPIDELKRIWSVQEARMRFRRQIAKILLLRPNLRSLLHGISTILITPRDWQRIDLPDQLFPLYALLRPLLWLEAEFKGLSLKNRPSGAPAKSYS